MPVGWLKLAVAPGPSTAPAVGPPATLVIVVRSALSRLTWLPAMNEKLYWLSWTIPAVLCTSACGRRPLIGNRVSVTLLGAVTVNVALLLVVALCPLQSSTASNSAPLSLLAAVRL